MQINPHCTKIKFKNVRKATFSFVTAIALSAAFSSCSADDIEMPMKTDKSSEVFMKKSDSIPLNDSIPVLKDGEIDPPISIPPRK